MPKDDSVRLRHRLDAAREALSFASGKRRKDLETDRMLVLSLLRSIEIIGEAASHVSLECQEKYPEIPWAQIVAMRNRLVHAYFDVDLDQVWQTLQDDLPRPSKIFLRPPAESANGFQVKTEWSRCN